jgi:hypothetical protein
MHIVFVLFEGGVVQRQNSGLILRISARLAQGLGSNPSAPIISNHQKPVFQLDASTATACRVVV